MLMGSDCRAQQPFYSYNPNRMGKKSFNTPQAFDGMNQTLAPSVLDTNTKVGDLDSPISASADSMNPYGLSSMYGGFDANFNDAFKSNEFMTSGLNSGQITPNGDWQNLIDGNVWEDNSSQPTAV